MPQRALRCAFKYWHSLQPALRASAVNAAGLRNCVALALVWFCPHPCSAVKRSELPAQRAATNPMLTAYQFGPETLLRRADVNALPFTTLTS